MEKWEPIRETLSHAFRKVAAWYMDKNINPVRKLIRRAGAPAMALHIIGLFSIPPLVDEKDEVLKRLSLSKQDIYAMTNSRVAVTHPERRGALILQLSTLLPNRIRLYHGYYKDRDSSYYPVHGDAYNHALFGNKGLIDTLTLYRTGGLSSCAVTVPSARLSAQSLISQKTGIETKLLKNIPGGDEDYHKIILFHELHHCNQRNVIGIYGAHHEYEADEAALSHYLRLGGQENVVRAWLHKRALTSFIYALSTWDNNDPDHNYDFAPTLRHRFFGDPFISQRESGYVYKDIARLLVRNPPRDNPWRVYDLNYQIEIMKSLLENPSSPLTEKARLVMRQIVEASDFFRNPPAPAPTTTLPPAAAQPRLAF